MCLRKFAQKVRPAIRTMHVFLCVCSASFSFVFLRVLDRRVSYPQKTYSLYTKYILAPQYHTTLEFSRPDRCWYAEITFKEGGKPKHLSLGIRTENSTVILFVLRDFRCVFLVTFIFSIGFSDESIIPAMYIYIYIYPGTLECLKHCRRWQVVGIQKSR